MMLALRLAEWYLDCHAQKISKITVTAAIHNIVKMDDLQIKQDLVFRGKVDWVGRSSAVVTLELFRDSGVGKRA